MIHHRRGLRRLLRDAELIHRLEEDFESAGLDARQLTMLRYVATLTKKPWAITDRDINELREVGFTEEDILAIAEISAYYAFVNRIADGLGVEIEPWTPRG